MANRFCISVHENTKEPVWFNRVEPFLLEVSKSLCYDAQEISVLFCGDDFIAELNAQYRNISAPTDVLSFENGESYTDDEGEWLCSGDIIISLETLEKNAKYFGENVDAELKRLFVHGILHLNGMDHGDEHLEKGKKPDCEMLVLQENILEKFSSYHIISE